MYMAYKHFHLLMVVLSVSFLLVRYAMSLKPAAMLQTKFFKIAPHVIDTLLLVSAVLLMLTLQQYPFVHAWLTEKFLAVLAYIALGVMAFKGRTAAIRWICFLGALGWLGLVLRVAMTKQPVFLTAF
ncbi:MAG: invasion protein [Gammaproteobacteria bacterium HGW-Gammaproteobacteria-15]|uniref:SirB2 family protein n=1 Tax=Rheinheimera pacifica TaxID=173990 RepID=UPI000CAF2DB2|nr:SirB2 family protein [Rheinheimera pacifica]MCS4308146.1 putative membrane protein SirB2 [Rheinheimera pacifica]PKM20907.1 MAG: invasion protein [Gammaproteobacteria bacterium HGW-Gammaproteobacteria-15]